jgi:hypothetical protein
MIVPSKANISQYTHTKTQSQIQTQPVENNQTQIPEKSNSKE